jgi:hypothetical protein
MDLYVSVSLRTRDSHGQGVELGVGRESTMAEGGRYLMGLVCRPIGSDVWLCSSDSQY